MPNDEKRIPLTIISGFLGAGKTTLLNRILHTEHGLRIAVLVNDFGAIDIDSQLVVGVEGETISLANGCICCTIRDDLIKAVTDLLQREDSPEYIIVETSGVSDPLEVALSLRTVEAIRIDSVLSVIDAEQILSIDKRYEVLAMDQIGMADIIILNKVDLVNEVALQNVRDYIYSIIPGSRIFETTHAQVPMALILNVGAFDVERLVKRHPQGIHIHDAYGDEHDEHHHHDDHTLIFNTWSWTSHEALSYRALRRMTKKLPESIYRAKGIFYLADAPERRGVLQIVGRRATLTLGEYWGDTPPYSQMVVIGSPDDFDVERLGEQLEACLAKNAPQSEWTYLTQSVVGWLREHLTGKRE